MPNACWLSPKHRHILSVLVRVHEKTHGTMWWDGAEKEPVVRYGQFPFVRASREDLTSLTEGGYLAVQFHDSGTRGEVSIRNRAYLAVQRKFWCSTEDLVLGAIHVLAGGEEWAVALDKIAESTRLAPEAIRAEALKHLEDGLVVEGRTFLENKPGFALTKAGIAVVESQGPPHGSSAAGDTYNMNFNQPVASVQAGNNITARVTQSVGHIVTKVLPILSDCREAVPQLPAGKQGEAREALDDLEDELRSPRPKRSRLRAFLTVLLAAGIGLAAFTYDVMAIAKELGFRPEEIGGREDGGQTLRG